MANFKIIATAEQVTAIQWAERMEKLHTPRLSEIDQSVLKVQVTREVNMRNTSHSDQSNMATHSFGSSYTPTTHDFRGSTNIANHLYNCCRTSEQYAFAAAPIMSHTYSPVGNTAGARVARATSGFGCTTEEDGEESAARQRLVSVLASSSNPFVSSSNQAFRYVSQPAPAATGGSRFGFGSTPAPAAATPAHGAFSFGDTSAVPTAFPAGSADTKTSEALPLPHPISTALPYGPVRMEDGDTVAAVDISDISKALQQLVREPATDSERKAKFLVYENFIATVETIRKSTLAFWKDLRTQLEKATVAAALLELNEKVKHIDDSSNLSIYFESSCWFVHSMVQKAQKNNDMIALLLEDMKRRCSALASQTDCPMCLDPFEEDTAVQVLACCHRVCQDCWGKWCEASARKPFCPLCRHTDFVTNCCAYTRATPLTAMPTPATGGFTFGDSTSAGGSGFTFGISTPASGSGFTFGDSTPVGGSGFTFGNSSTSATNHHHHHHHYPMPASRGFSFGNTSTTRTPASGGFSLGGNSETRTRAYGAFSFGGPSGSPTPASGGFSFGSTSITPMPSSVGFSFGGNSAPTASPAAGGFSFSNTSGQNETYN